MTRVEAIRRRWFQDLLASIAKTRAAEQRKWTRVTAGTLGKRRIREATNGKPVGVFNGPALP